jgi:hypothetical protein
MTASEYEDVVVLGLFSEDMSSVSQSDTKLQVVLFSIEWVVRGLLQKQVESMRRGIAEIVPAASRLDSNFDRLLFFSLENLDNPSLTSFCSPFDSRELAWYS